MSICITGENDRVKPAAAFSANGTVAQVLRTQTGRRLAELAVTGNAFRGATIAIQKIELLIDQEIQKTIHAELSAFIDRPEVAAQIAVLGVLDTVRAVKGVTAPSIGLMPEQIIDFF